MTYLAAPAAEQVAQESVAYMGDSYPEEPAG